MNIKKLYEAAIFFIGWILSPFTWWNDVFVNIPLSYLMANVIFYLVKLPFKWLVLGSYWFTNALGIFMMYIGGKCLVRSSAHRRRTVFIMIMFLFAYSAVMLYLDSRGKLLPLGAYFEKFYVKR